MRTTRKRTASVVALGAGLVLGACSLDGLLEVPTPDVVTPEDIQGANGAGLFADGALGQFAREFGNGQVLTSGFVTDEFHYAGVFPTSVIIDSRSSGERSGGTGYDGLHDARVGTENAADIVAEFLPDDPRLAKMHALAGFTYVFFGENFCSGVPFGRTLPGGEQSQGEQQTTEQTFGIALERFASAAATTAGSTDMERLAAVGSARALLNLGQYAEAAGRVAGVPTDWAHFIRYTEGSSGSQENDIYWSGSINRTRSLSDREGGNGLPFRSAMDPRVPWVHDGGTGANQETLLYEQMKYSSREDDVVLADGIEARLIEAEAALQADDVPVMMAKLNALRATIGLDDLSDPGDMDGRVDLLFYERAFWMFATGHRLGDMRRLVRQYGRSPDTVFPVGAYHLGGVYDTGVVLVIPDDEYANPNYTGCFSVGA